MNEQLEARLARLERTNRRYRLAIVGLVAGIVAATALGFDQNIYDVVRARRFEVVDSTGAVLTEIGYDASGGRVLARRRDGGGALFFTNAEGGALGLLTPDGHVPFRAGVSPKGGLLVITNRDDQFVMMAAADDSSGGAMILYDKTGRELWHAP
jgi:hypothetical protein